MHYSALMHYLAVAIAGGLMLLPPACFAQSPSPYAGFETRAIKALSDQQVSELRAGLGMSLALAAELNGYPGPRHTLEYAEQLKLSATQRAKVEGLFSAMQAESIAIGEKLISQEAELDGHFARKTITPGILLASTQSIGSSQAALRATHLKYHLLTIEILSPAQVQRYIELRGYAADPQHDPRPHRNPH